MPEKNSVETHPSAILCRVTIQLKDPECIEFCQPVIQNSHFYWIFDGQLLFKVWRTTWRNCFFTGLIYYSLLLYLGISQLRLPLVFASHSSRKFWLLLLLHRTLRTYWMSATRNQTNSVKNEILHCISHLSFTFGSSCKVIQSTIVNLITTASGPFPTTLELFSWVLPRGKIGGVQSISKG